MNSCCGLRRPVVIAAGVAVVHALHFLQEQDVRREAVQLLPQLVDDHPPREMREAFVDVVGGDAELHHGGTEPFLQW